ncbi:MAG: glycosyltransferase [Candidatus Aminicenantes bacterium]|nr:glycosyltransferase [Candidatus Aminicenantes bacterium]
MSLFQIDAGKEWRGGQRQSLLLATELKKKGYPLYFVVQPRSPLYEQAQKAGLSVIPIKMRSEVDILAVTRLAAAMKKKKCRLVHFHDAHSVSVGSPAASLAGVPIKIISRRVDFPLKDNFLSRQKYIKNIDCIIAVSKGVRKVLIEGGVPPKSIKVIPDGIDYSPFGEASSSDYLRQELSFKKKDFLVGIVAHLADHKGHKYLIRAARILKEKAPKIKFIIVGEGPLKMELTRQVSESHVGDIVYFLGFRDDIPRILCSLDLFVLSSYLEGLGSSLLDAMACRLPIVATKAGGIPEVVVHRETGLLVPTRNSRALAAAILKLYEDRELARQLGDNGFEHVHGNFSAEAMAGKIIDQYDKLARKKGIKLNEY